VSSPLLQDGGAGSTGHLFPGAASVLARGGKLFVWLATEATAAGRPLDEATAIQDLLQAGRDAGLEPVASTPAADGSDAAMLIFKL
jgi:hypothetical protein